MKLMKAVMLLAGAGLVPGTLPGAIAADDVSEEKLELAQKVVELQRTRDFLKAEWEFEKQTILEEVPANRQNAQLKTWLNVTREHMVDGKAEAMIEALAAELDEASLRSAARLIGQHGQQKWIADQLEAFPTFLARIREREEAASSVMAGQLAGTEKRNRRMAEIEPVGDSRLGAALGITPGARLNEQLDNPFSSTMRVPVTDRAIAEFFPDMSVELFPGQGVAHVISVNGTRAYPDESSCEAARGKLTGELSVYFPDTEATDCGTKRFLDADRKVRMRAYCREQDLGAASILNLQITHIPSQDAAYSALDADTAPE